MQINQITAVCMLIGLIATSCNRNKTENNYAADNTNASVSRTLTSKQIKNLDIEIVRINMQVVERYVECTGRVDLPPSDYIRITVPVGGILNALYVTTGEYVRSGTLLADLEHPDYLKIQQEFLETKNRLKYYQEEFKRQGELTIEDASSVKKMQKAEMDYRITEVSLMTQKEKLKLIGIDADSLHIENISPAVRLYAPKPGYISVHEVVPGSFIPAGQPVCELVNPQHAYILLQIPEQYALQVKSGQSVSYTLTAHDSFQYPAIVQSTGFIIDQDSQTFDATAILQDPVTSVLPGMTVCAKVKIKTDSAYLIPSQAIVSAQSGTHIMMYDHGTITRIPVVTGTVHQEFTEIISPGPALLGKDFAGSGTGILNAFIEDL